MAISRRSTNKATKAAHKAKKPMGAVTLAQAGASIAATRKPKTARGARILKQKEPQLVEKVKRALMLFGGKSSQLLKDAMLGIATVKGKEDVVRLARRNDGVRPLEAGGEVLLEKLARQWECGLFTLATHSKKRPNNITVGRVYDGNLYDVLEMAVQRYEANGFAEKDASVPIPNVAPNSKPMMVFSGAGFERSARGKLAKNVLVDLFRGRIVDNVNLAGVDRVVLCFLGPDSGAAAGNNVSDDEPDEGVVYVRHCAVVLKKSGQNAPSMDGGRPIHLPYVHLVDVGPSFEFRLGRYRLPPPEVAKEACRRSLKPSDKAAERKASLKNTESDELEGRVGRMYAPRQDLSDLQAVSMKRMAARERRLARREREDEEEEEEEEEEEDDN